jgi:ankyrin repeat protein
MMTAAVLLLAADLFSAIRAQDVPAVEKLLASDPALASTRDEKGASAVSAAMAARKGEGFLPRRENRVLDAILRARPQLTAFETCAVGTPVQVLAQITKDKELVRSRAGNGWTPLHFAAFADNAAAAAVLIEAGAEVDARARNKFDNTPLQVALLTSSREVAKVLLSNGAQVNATQAEGVTALHEAASSGDVEIVRMLLAAGADPLAKSSLGTPLDVAVKNHHEEAAKLLRR